MRGTLGAQLAILISLLPIGPARAVTIFPGIHRHPAGTSEGQATQQLEEFRSDPPSLGPVVAQKTLLTGAQRKVESHLRKLAWPRPAAEVSSATALGGGGLQALGPSPNPQVYVQIGAATRSRRAQLEKAGLKVEIVDSAHGVVQGRIDPAGLARIAALRFVAAIRPVDRVRTRVGSAASEGDGASGADLVRQEGLDGSGVAVGVISDGIDSLAAAQASGNLGAVMMPADARCRRGAGDEGTALLEIVHDLAPGAPLLFSGPSTSLEFIQSVQCLVEAGARVIVDDLGFLGEPYFEDGPVASAVRQAVEMGVSYHSSAGNEAEQHLEQMYRPSPTTAYHDFLGGPVDNGDDMWIPAYGIVECFLQWDDAFGHSANDYDLYLLDDNQNVIDESTDLQLGSQDPIEAVGAYNPASFPRRLHIAIKKVAGSARTLKMFCYGGDDQQYVTPSGSIFGHPAVPEVVAVAAIDVQDPGLDDVETYSSRGPTTIVFPASSVRAKPDIAAFDGVSISNAGGFPECPPFCRFFGTSAAAPHSAAVAALLLQKNPLLTPQDIRRVLTASAADIDAPGLDPAAGAGRLDAEAAAGLVAVAECVDDAGCNDGTACTLDRCQGWTCVHEAVVCDDGNVCNGIETCDAVSGCRYGVPPVCDDGDRCTRDTCEAARGCVAVPLAGLQYAMCRFEELRATLDGAADGDVTSGTRTKLRRVLQRLGANLTRAEMAEVTGAFRRERRGRRVARGALQRFSRVTERALGKRQMVSALAEALGRRVEAVGVALTGP
jgi:subtilisin family serine protease